MSAYGTGVKPGQRVRAWWQQYVMGRLRSPQDLYAAATAERGEDDAAFLRFLEDPLDGDVWDVPKRLSYPQMLVPTPTDGMMHLRSRADWQHVDPWLIRWAALFQQAARKRGIPLYVHCAFRTKAEQDDAFKRRVSKLRWPNGPHCIGEAVDIVHARFQWHLTPQEWKFLHFLGREVERRYNATLKKQDQRLLEWGGDFKSLYDPAHWQIAGYQARIREIEAGEPVRLNPAKVLSRA